MRKVFKYFFLSIISLITLIVVFVPEDPAWIDCSDESDLYRYVYNGWKVDKVIKDYKGEYPRIWLSKNDRIKALNFRLCYYLELQLNFKKDNKWIKKKFKKILIKAKNLYGEDDVKEFTQFHPYNLRDGIFHLIKKRF